MIIYKITNSVNGRFYIGKTEGTLRKRWQRHCNEAHRSIHPNIALHGAIRKYGESSFSLEVLRDAINREQLSRLEREKIKEAREAGHRLYNLTDGGDGSLGLKHSLSARIKQSAAAIRRRGARASRACPCVVNGVEYPSVTEAARRLRACTKSIKRWASGSPFRLKSVRSDYRGSKLFKSYANPALIPT